MIRHPVLDKNGKCDLFVVANSQFGDSALTPRLHFMEDSVPIGLLADLKLDSELAPFLHALG